MNMTHITGNLTADIETLPINDKSLSKFTVACNQGDRTVFLPVEVWNHDYLQDHLHKGSKVLVSGSLRQNTWLNKEGERRSRLILVGQYIEFLDPKAREGSNSKPIRARETTALASSR